MPTSASDQELLTRQAALQAEAAQVLAELDLGQLFADVGPVLVVGSYLSGLMCWRDLDVCLLAGEECCQSLPLDPDDMIGIDLHKRLFLLITGRGE
jgi:hypothetical protein